MKRKFQKSNNTDYSLAHVLYQKLGSDWYAFAEKDGDCFMTKVSAEVAEQSNSRENKPSAGTKRKAA